MTAVSAAIHCFGCRYSFEGAVEILRRRSNSPNPVIPVCNQSV